MQYSQMRVMGLVLTVSGLHISATIQHTTKKYPKVLKYWEPNIINFPFVSNGKLIIFTCSNIQAHYDEAVICLNFGTPESNEFSIWDKWKFHYF